MEAELHLFRGRLLVASGPTGGGRGKALAPNPTATEIGELLLRLLRGDLAAPERPLVRSIQEVLQDQAEADKRWEAFCRDEAGVAPQQYKPEIRIDIYEDGDDSDPQTPNEIVIRPLELGGSPDHTNERRLPETVDATALGEAALDLVRATKAYARFIGSASAYRRGRRFVVIAEVGTPSIGMLRPPVFVLDETATDEDLGRTISAAAAAYEELEIEPSDETNEAWQSEIFRVAGVKDWAALEHRAKLVSVTLDTDGWQLTPMVRSRAAWIGGDDSRSATKKIRLEPDSNSAVVGAGLRRALAGPTLSA